MNNRFVPALGMIVIATLLQVGLAPYIALGGIVPNMLLLVAITLALIQGPRSGMIAGFSAGLIFDLLGTAPVGPAALAFCVVGFIAGSLQANTFAEGWTLPLVILFVASMLAEVAYGLILAVLGEWGAGAGAVFTVMLPGAVYNAALAVLVYPWLARFLRQDRSVTMFGRIT
jgi:rod shape-determining protein MreD